ncbi:MAG: DMT family transporter [Myxococcota bacterium]
MTATALGIVLLSAFLHALWSTSIKASRDPLAFNLLQAVLTLVPGLAVIACLDLQAVPREVWLALLGTSVSHGIYFFLLSRALARGDLTLIYPIARSTPALLPLVAVPLLGESVSFGGAIGIATVVVGMWLVSTRGEVSWRALLGPGIGFAYLTLLSTVAYSLFDKVAMAGLDEIALGGIPVPIAFYFLLSAGGLLCFLPLALPGLDRHELVHTARREWKQVAVAASVGLLGYGLILEAYRTAPASYVVAVRQTSVLFAMGFGVRLLHEGPGRVRLLGAAATVVGVVLIALFP